VVGVVGFALVGAIPVVGNLAEAVAVLLGLGAIALGHRDGYGGDGDGSADGPQATLDETPRDAAS
jgi:hypothetical protein